MEKFFWATERKEDHLYCLLDKKERNFLGHYKTLTNTAWLIIKESH
jgi:hypothetical protein